VVDDFIHNLMVCEESDDPHLSSALRADERVNLIDFPNHPGLALDLYLKKMRNIFGMVKTT